MRVYCVDKIAVNGPATFRVEFSYEKSGSPDITINVSNKKSADSFEIGAEYTLELSKSEV